MERGRYKVPFRAAWLYLQYGLFMTCRLLTKLRLAISYVFYKETAFGCSRLYWLSSMRNTASHL